MLQNLSCSNGSLVRAWISGGCASSEFAKLLDSDGVAGSRGPLASNLLPIFSVSATLRPHRPGTKQSRMKSIHAVVVAVLGAGLILLFASATPRLEIAGQGTNAVIFWSATNSTNFVLQQTPVPGSSNDWIAVPTLPASGTDTFYVV